MKKTKFVEQYIDGIRSALPVILGFIPVGIAYAIMARHAGFTTAETCTMSLTVFAGASEMMAIGMYEKGAGIIAIILATFILNLRHVIMSTCVFNEMKPSGIGTRLLAGFGVTDETFAIFTTARNDRRTMPFFLGLATVSYVSWNVGTFIGAVSTDILPEIVTASLGIALYAMFIGLIMPALRVNLRLTILVIFTAAVNSVLNLFIESSWALIISTLVCAAVGVFFVHLGDEEDENAA